MNMAVWREFWSALRLGESSEQGLMKIFPLGHSLPPHLGYLTLEEALKTGAGAGFSVQEVSNQGSVTELRVVNRLDRPVLLVEGEILLGAKQNRSLHTSVLVGEDSDVTIPVACVEAGRWSRAPRGGFSVSGHFTHAKLRYEKLRHAASRSAGARDEGAGQATSTVNQGEVWAEVAMFSSLAGVSSATSDADEVYGGLEGKSESHHDFEYRSGTAGIAVCIEGQLVGVECFDRPSTMEKMFPRLVRSYATEAFRRQILKKRPDPSGGTDPEGRGPASLLQRFRGLAGGQHPQTGAAPSRGGNVGDSPSQIDAFLREIAAAEVSAGSGAGLGDDLRAQTTDWSAAVLIHGGTSLYGQVLLRSD